MMGLAEMTWIFAGTCAGLATIVSALLIQVREGPGNARRARGRVDGMGRVADPARAAAARPRSVTRMHSLSQWCSRRS